MINGNLVGFVMVIVSAVAVALPGYLFRLPDAVTMVGVGVVLIAADIGLRLTRRGSEKWLMGQQTGGYLIFIPVWTFGIAMIVLNLVNALIIKK